MSTETNNESAAAKIAESIAALPPLPVTAQKVLTCFGDEFIDVDKVTAVVEGDPGICARLLGLSNSAYFGLAEPVCSIREAICRVLGVDTVRSLVLAMAIQRSFNSRRCPAFNTDRFWMQSLLTAECCKKIAATEQSLDTSVRDLAYSTGLCHNLGLMAVAHMEPQRTSAVLHAHSESEQPEHLGQRFVAEFGTDHKLLTAELARFWQLPEIMLSAYQSRARRHENSDNRLGLILSAAATAAGNMLTEKESQVDLGVWAGRLDMESEDLEQIVVLSDRTQNAAQAMCSNMGD